MKSSLHSDHKKQTQQSQRRDPAAGFAFTDNRPEAAQTKSLLGLIRNSQQVQQAKAVQAKIKAGSAQSPVQMLTAPAGNPDLQTHRTYTPNAGRAGDSNVMTPTNHTATGGTVTNAAPIAGTPWIGVTGSAGTWIKFHMINRLLGGKGTDYRNLVYTTQTRNLSTAWRNFEVAAQNYDANGATYVTVEANYMGNNPHTISGVNVNESDFPSRIRGQIHTWDVTNQVWVHQNGDDVDMNNIADLPPMVANTVNMLNWSANVLGNRLGLRAESGRLLHIGIESPNKKPIRRGTTFNKELASSGYNDGDDGLALFDAMQNFIYNNKFDVTNADDISNDAKTNIIYGNWRIA